VSCIRCGAKAVTERSDRTAQGYRRFRCRTCGKQFNERAGTLLNRAQYPSNVIALVVLWRLRYKLSLRELPEMFLIRGIVFSHEAVRDWEAKLTPALAEGLRRHRRGKVGRGWYVAETYIKVNGQWPTLEQPPGSHFAIRPPAAGRTFDATRLPRREPPLIPAVMTRFHRKLPPKSRRLWNPNPSE
jgi:DNA-directed RNA polymerase subunit RPC12/RpoP